MSFSSRTFLLFLVLFLEVQALAQGWIIPTGSVWRFRKGTNEASNPIGLWRELSFPDTTWALAPAPFHYGDGLTTGTALNDMRGNYTCIYLRREFVVTNIAEIQLLNLAVDYDDGFIAWINGREAAASGAPNNLAYTSVSTLSHEGGSPVTFTPSLPPTSILVEGTNVIAVQAFNVNLANSTDFRIDLGLQLVRSDGKPPELASYSPSASHVDALTQIQVVFTEPVVGIQASDLRINDQPAATVTGGPASDRYTFSFTQPSPGSVIVSWNESQRITDSQGNPFNAEAPNATWSYVLEDTVPPRIMDRIPAVTATVSRLNEVVIQFDEPVIGLEAADLLINGLAATNLSGAEAGPYHFTFSQPDGGTVRFAWVENHGIQDGRGNPFGGGSWTVTLNPSLSAGDLRINEFVAANETGLKDEDNEAADWIELYNAGTEAVSLLGWSLTDDRGMPGKWSFPDYRLNPGAYLVIFASGKDRRSPVGSNRFHTNFRLNAFGEYLALFNAESPRASVSEFSPRFPEQRNGYSFGRDPSGAWRYFTPPTPGASNGTSTLLEIAPPPQFSMGRGRFEIPLEVSLTVAMDGATIRYSTDGSDPARGGGTEYRQPLRISTTTILRAATFKAGYLPSRTQTESYLFLDDVVNQSANPPGFPSSWGTSSGFPNNQIPADYEMDLDPLRVDPENPNSDIDPVKLQRLRDGLRQLPLVSVVMDPNDLFGAGGLYPSASDSNKQSNEKACSVEMILPDGSPAFAIQGGLDLHGNASRNPLKNPKHGFKLKFKGDYGESVLDYRLFPDSPTERFDDLILRADFNSSWRHWSDVAGNGNGAFQRSRGTRTRYAWSQETFRDMGHVSSHTRFFHLFLNGLYWGTYDFGEQPTGNFAQTYFGGPHTSHDIYDQGALREGTSAAYNAMQGISGLASPENYDRIQQLLDVTQFIDYTLLHFYIGHQDWGANKNWYAIRPRLPGGAGAFRYLPWDQECILLEENVNRVPNSGGSSDLPSGLHPKLQDNAEYRLAFADRVFKHLIAPGGALTPGANIARWQKWQALLDEPIVAESCRWGDYRRDVHRYSDGSYQLYTRENHWMKENDRLVNSYFLNRGQIVLNQLRSANLYPKAEPPIFNQPGGLVSIGFQLTVTAPSGVIYLTTNGADPRLPGIGAVSPHAKPYSGPVTLEHSTLVRARVLQSGTWSALNEAPFAVGELGLPLRFTEIMYNPPGGDAYEFVELQNIGTIPVDMSGFSLKGIDYIFPEGTILAPGAVFLICSAANTEAFHARYPSSAVNGIFQGNLDNGGERLALLDRGGQTVCVVQYDDEGGWPLEADGKGQSLEADASQRHPSAADHWHASPLPGGTPGLPPAAKLAESIVLNEIMADNVSAVEHEGTFPDWIELYNSASESVELGGWSLSDDGNPRKFVFPSGTSLAPQSYMVVWCDSLLTDPGMHTGFALNRNGDQVFLFNAATNRVDALSFGLQVPDRSIGRMDESWQLTLPTPNQANLPAPLASATNVVLNEWLANSPPGGDDWIELYNRSASEPAAPGRFYVATGSALSQISSLAFLPPRGYVQLIADEKPGWNHLEMKLPAHGGSLALFDSNGHELDRITYAPQIENISQGRMPDGGTEIVDFPKTPSPGQANHTNSPSSDTDSDGLPDEWESAHGTHLLVQDAEADPDQDGMTNLQEYQAGTDPQSAASLLSLRIIRAGSDEVAFEFQAVANRSYSLLYKDLLDVGPWHKLADASASNSGRLVTISDLSPSPTGRYYRLVTPAISIR